MRVYLADLVHNARPGANVLTGSQDYTTPLNIGHIGAYVKQVYGDKVNLRLFKYPTNLLAAVEDEPPTVLGFSHYAWNSDLNAQIGQYVKKHYPETMTVMGGPSIRITNEDIEIFLKQNKWLDAYVMYEGERPFANILRHVFENGTDLSKDKDRQLRNVAYLAGDDLHFETIAATEQGSLDEFPSPYLNGFMDEFLDQEFIPLFETNRGCPFSCTFCAWGIASMDKVRRFPMDRILGEIDYVADKAPQRSVWFFADANFGILRRDVEIAKKIQEVRSRTSLREIMVYDSKNTHERNKEIAQILGKFDRQKEIASMNMALIAVQSMSPEVLKHIKRDNIDFSGIAKLIGEYHDVGVEVKTDVIYALPGESWEEAISTVGKCFEVGFDYIHINRALMLPGAEMETDESRKNYGLKTKFMVRRGSYGDYSANHGTLRSMEVDELVSGSPTFSEEEVLTFNVLTWLVFIGWNHGRLSSLLKYLRDETKVNPVDLLVKLMEVRGEAFADFSELLEDFKRDVDAVMFEDREAMLEHFYKEENWASLMSYIRVELRYNAMLYSDHDLHDQMNLAIRCAIGELGLDGDPVIEDLMTYIQANFVDVHSIVKNEPCPEKVLNISGTALRYIDHPDDQEIDETMHYDLVLRKSLEDQAATREFLLEYEYTDDPINAIERLLGARYASVIYDAPYRLGDPAVNMQTRS